MKTSLQILDRINEITTTVMNRNDSGAIRCLADEDGGGIPSNFIGAIRRVHGDEIADEFFELIIQFAESFKKEDQTRPNIVTLHFDRGELTAELRSEYYLPESDKVESFSWLQMKPRKPK